MSRPVAPLVVCVVACALALGCGEIRYGPGQSYDQVLRTGQRVVPGHAVRAQAWQQGSELQVRATRRCDLVAYNEIERTTYREPEEDPTEEIVVLGVAAIPIVTGVIVLADSAAVYDNDRNAPQYNPVGSGGAIVAGVILVSLGAALATVPVVELVRGSITDEQQSIVREPGETLRENVPCRGGQHEASGAAVVGRFDGVGAPAEHHQVLLGQTDESGRLVVDLAEVIPAKILQDATMPRAMQVYVEEQLVGLVDLDAVREAAKKMLRSLPEAPTPAVTVAVPSVPEAPRSSPSPPSGDDPGAAEQAAQQAQRAARQACVNSCTAGCSRDAKCRARCIEEACP